LRTSYKFQVWGLIDNDNKQLTMLIIQIIPVPACQIDLKIGNFCPMWAKIPYFHLIPSPLRLKGGQASYLPTPNPSQREGNHIFVPFFDG
jgi:hypothetical protein